MTLSSRFCAVLILLILSFEVFSQSISLTGKVVDAQTDEPIPFVNIGALNTSKGTSSNINGEFVLVIDSLPKEIFFSHLNYSPRGIKVIENNTLLIKLNPVDNVLDAITIEGKKRGDYLINLISKAYNKALYSRYQQYGKAFYRQTSKTGTRYSELYEIFYDTKFSDIGITDWEVQEGRYAMSTTALANKNFTLLSRIISTIQPNTNDFIMPINPLVEDYYEFCVIEVKKMGKREVARLNFVPFKRVKTPAFEGDVYIDINNFDILKIKGKIQNDELSFVKITGDGTWQNYVLDYELAYRESADSLLLDYISIDQSFDYYRENELVYPVKTVSQLTFYEHYQPRKNKKLGGNINTRRSDATILDKIGYNKEFWDENAIVKRTPIELEVIESFESKKAFGTIYLNDQKQIVLERNDILKDTLVNEMLVKFQRNTKYQEKAYLHLDKPYYTVGERMWYSGYVVDASSHKRFYGSGVLYIDLVDPDGNIVVSQNIEVVQGLAKGDVFLKNDLLTGKYILRAYTNWMRNLHPDYFFKKEIVIYNEATKAQNPPNKEKEISLRFFPEGGDMLAGVTNRIGFKAINDAGKGVEINGKIIDNDGNRVADLESIHLGMGSFFLNAQEGKSYHAKIFKDGNELIFPLPLVMSSGIMMQVNNNNQNTIKVIIQTTKEFNDKSFYIIGQSRGQIYARTKGLIQDNRSIIELPKAKVPDGIFQITLFDENGLPQCERLVFVDHQRELAIDFSLSDSIIASREPVEFNFQVSDVEGRPIKSNFSIAVTDAGQLTKSSKQENIKSYLLLNSDIKGVVEQPGYYFKNREKETIRNLDILMLTQGWRRFAWKEMLAESRDFTKYPMEKGLTISGMALDPIKSSPLSKTSLAILIFAGEKPIAGLLKTDDIGRFEISNLHLPDSVNILINQIGEKNQVSKVDVKLANQKYLFALKGTGEYLEELTIGQEELAYIESDEERKAIERAFGEQDIKILDEVKIEAKKEYSPSTIHGTPDAVIKPDNTRVFFNIFQMIQGQVAGVNVIGNTDIRIRNSPGPPFVLLDGMPIVQPTGSYFGGGGAVGGGASDAEGDEGGQVEPPAPDADNGLQALMSIPPNDVERIEILKGPSAAIYGTRGANGVIAIYTKRGGEPDSREAVKNVFELTFEGFYTAKEFYSPKYEVSLPEHAKPDKRATLFWNANVQTDENGKASISFYNSDIGNHLQVDIQGLSESGEPISRLIPIGEKRE